MSLIVRPRRSVLYMPGSNPRALEKAEGLKADGLILDLEDAVAPASKEEARQLVADTVRARPYGRREVFIRVNGLDTDWGEADLKAAAVVGPDAILLPKINGARDIHDALAVIDAAGGSADIAIWAMMETPLGILHAEEIAAASDRMAGFVMGTSDLVKDLRAQHTAMRLPVMTSLNTCLLAARAYGLAVLDGVYLDLEDATGFEQSCVQGRELGMDGKTLIHPKQLEAANRVFRPSADDLAFGHKIIAAHAAAAREGKGLLLVDGKLIENLHVENAYRLIAEEEAIQAMDTEPS